MTILRSREIVPTLNSKSPTETLEKNVISMEPITPMKTLKKSFNSLSSESTPSSSPFDGSLARSDSGTNLRRSLRLASKSCTSEIKGNNSGLSQKRKNSSVSDTESQSLDFVSGELDSGVVDCKEKSEAEFKLDLLVNEGSLVCGIGEEFGSGSGSLRSVVVPKKGKGKRKLGVNVDFSELEATGDDVASEACLKLRSGKKIVSSRVGRGYVGENLGGSEPVYKNAKGGEDSEMRKVSSSRSVEGTAINNTKGELAVIKNGSVKDRQRLSSKVNLLGKTSVKHSVDCVMLDAKVDSSVGNSVSHATSLTGVLDPKGLENDPNADENDKGDKGRKRFGREENTLLSSRADAMELDLPKEGKSNEMMNSPRVDTIGTSAKGRKRLSRKEKGKGKAAENDLSSNWVDAVKLDLSNVENSKEVGKHPSADINGIDDKGSRRRLSREEKGKAKLVENAVKLNSAKVEKSNEDNVAVQGGSEVLENAEGNNVTRTRERFRNIARRNASKFAHFSSNDEKNNRVVDEAELEMPSREVEGKEDWPGPFSTAMKIIKDRALNSNAQQNNLSVDKAQSSPVNWVPKQDQNRKSLKLSVPSLQELCMEILAKNADAISSLDCVPDVLRHKLSHLLCDSRRMNNHFLDLLVRGSPTEIRVRDCSWLSEEHFSRTFEGTDLNKLMVLQLDQCGRCMPDYILVATLARSLGSLPVLTTISLKGACRLSDVGLSSLLSSAPSLRSINLGQCSLLTSVGINILANSVGSVLRELYLDDCQSIDAILILPALSKFEQLQVLSVSGLQNVCDDFVSQFVVVRGHNLKELILTDCVNLTDSSIKVISETCTGLCSLDLTNLYMLTDSAIGYLANGCMSIRSLQLRRNAFSDEAIAAYLETCGESLVELSLNNVIKAAHNTAISLSRRSRNLQSLDLSWCRNMTNEAVGLIVDSCLSLKMLKLFGCTQITNVFLDGHSNAEVKMIGLKMSPVLEHIKVPDLVGPLHYSSVFP